MTATYSARTHTASPRASPDGWSLTHSAAYWTQLLRRSSPALPRYTHHRGSAAGLLEKDRDDRRPSATADMLRPRRQTALRSRLMLGLVSIWLAILFALMLRSPTAFEFDPLREKVVTTKKVVSPSDPDIYYVGRWSQNKIRGAVTDTLVSTMFDGMYLDVRFTGTSLGVKLGNVDSRVTVVSRVDRAPEYAVLPYGREVVSVVSGLPAGEHEVRLIFEGAERVDIEAFFVDRDARTLPYVTTASPRRPVFELLTDTDNSTAHDALTWPHLLADYFDADVVKIADDGACLSECPGHKRGLGNLFFLGNVYANDAVTSWHFDTYRPRVLLINIGAATKHYIDRKLLYKKMLPQDTAKAYTTEYVRLIEDIRRRAYKDTPIFIMRPLDGELEQESWRVVSDLRKRGDSQVHWLDTSLWTSGPADPLRHERVAAYMTKHVCSYLAGDPATCDFLPPFQSIMRRGDS
ncbi:uncharacterized protein V1510DRAFT_419814 [Dipodascopsis tothii]|uniref:uncharacterized protein n=1 Tax=Dipodascopsis tothii TaxID=44089 RepID=UPI0034CF46C4